MEHGKAMYGFVEHIFPYTRSITGEGVRQTLADLSEYIGADGGPQLTVHEVASGTQVFDWTVPKEWRIRAAYIENEAGQRIIDMADCNLHVMGYSTPVDEWADLEELKTHIFTEPTDETVIPYVTSYYKERYGFCMSKQQLDSLPEGRYHMVIDSELFDGVLNYAEVVLPGDSYREVFFSTYFCHPSMANNECSGPALSAELVRYVASLEHRKYTYRFIYVPETIGAITYLATGDLLQHLKQHMIAGFNLSCVGDDRTYSMVASKYGDTLADKVLSNVLKYHTEGKFDYYSFLKRGSDERQYNSPGVDLPVVCFCRSKFGEYPEYHTSADDLTLVSPEGFEGSYQVMTKVINALEYNEYYMVTVPCEPQLGKRGLFPTVSKRGSYDEVMTLMYFLTYADGRNDLLDISRIIDVPVEEIIKQLQKLLDNGLVKVLDERIS